MIKIEHQVFNWWLNNLRLLHSKIYSDNLVKYFSAILLYQFSDNIKIDLQEKYLINNSKSFIEGKYSELNQNIKELLTTKFRNHETDEE